MEGTPEGITLSWHRDGCRAKTGLAVSQFLPCVAAGGLLMIVLVRFAPDVSRRAEAVSLAEAVWVADPVLSSDHQLLAQQADEVFTSILVSDRSAVRRGERLLEEPGGD